MKSIKEISLDIDRTKSNKRGYRMFSAELKLEVVEIVEYRLKNGHSIMEICNSLNIEHSTVNKWRNGSGLADTGSEAKKRPKEVGFKFGKNQIRFDLRTKCLAVKDYIEEGKTKHELAEKFGATHGTIGLWVNKFKNNYNDFIDAPDGIPYVVKEENILRGLVDIDKANKEMIARLSDMKRETFLIQAKLDKNKKEERVILEKRLKEL